MKCQRQIASQLGSALDQYDAEMQLSGQSGCSNHPTGLWGPLVKMGN